MGRDKATLPFKNRPLITYVYGIVRQVLSEILIISKHHVAIEGIDSPIVRDITPKESSLVGIASALLYARTDYVFVVGCDMPFIRKETIRYMIDRISGEDILIPHTNAGYEPLHSIYSRSCLPHMLRAIDRGKTKITDLLPFLSVKLIEEPELFSNRGVSVFTNVNTEEDLALAESLISADADKGNEGIGS